MDTEKLRILAIGRNAEIMTVMQRLLNTPDNWTGLAVTTDDAALAAFDQEKFDIVLLCAGITAEEANSLTAHFQERAPETIVKRHYGGGSGLLKNEILYALENR